MRALALSGPDAGKFVMQKHWLGSDELGRDVLTRLAYGGRISLSVAFITMALALTIGLLVGVIAGYYGGWVDSILMRLVDVFISIPGLFVLILISTTINNNKLITNSTFFKNYGWLVLPFVIAALSWTTISRLLRGEFLAARERDYVEAARVLGASNGRIIFRHILPNVMPIIIVWASLVVPGLILTEAALSYLGFGVQIPTPSWGEHAHQRAGVLHQGTLPRFCAGHRHLHHRPDGQPDEQRPARRPRSAPERLMPHAAN